MQKVVAVQQTANAKREVRREASELAHVFVALQAELADLRKLLKCVAPVDAQSVRKQ